MHPEYAQKMHENGTQDLKFVLLTTIPQGVFKPDAQKQMCIYLKC